MAIPANDLDEFVTYTYHFELHCAVSWDDLKTQNVVSEVATTAFESNGTLMINTRKDAHQTIDDVQLDCIGPSTTLGDAPSGLTELRLSVKEPGGFSFIEKIKARMNQLQISEISNAVFGLKIIFVGRRGDNSIVTKQLRIIPLCLIHMNGSFTPEGGHYQLEFICYDTLASTRGGPVGQHLNYAFTSKNVAFEANTVEEALAKLELKLNENYEEVYKKELNNNGGSKKLLYKINFDSNIRGPVAGVVKNSFAIDDLKKFSFHPSQSITTVIMDIIKRCPQLCDRIGETSSSLRNSLHQGAFMPVITPKVYPKNDMVEICFDVSIYQGGGQKFEFDYFFTGKNVDITSYNIVFQQVTAFLATKTKSGADTGANFSATLPTDDAKRYMNLIHEPVTQTEIKYRPSERSDINCLKGDVAMAPAPSKRSSNAFNSMPFTAVQSVRKASDAIAEYAGAIDPEQILTIRGHYQILEMCVSRPDETDTTRLAAGGGLWTKVNIYMPDGENSSGKIKYKKFFYDGYYQIIVVTNIFSGGVFTQTIRMIMNEGFTE